MNQDHPGAGPLYHLPVLVEEVVELMAPVMPGLVVDATFGGGGHTRRLLDEFGEDVNVIGIDRDPDALANARGLRATVVEGNFAGIDTLVVSLTGEPVSGVLFDFGVSSHQLDEASRGFSYRSDGPLDMRMGKEGPTAAEIVNALPERDLADMLVGAGCVATMEAAAQHEALTLTAPLRTPLVEVDEGGNALAIRKPAEFVQLLAPQVFSRAKFEEMARSRQEVHPSQLSLLKGSPLNVRISGPGDSTLVKAMLNLLPKPKVKGATNPFEEAQW